MNHSEAADLVKVLHGAYPGTYIDESTVRVFTNSMLVSDFDIAQQAVAQWVSTMTRWPTIAELNELMRKLRGVEQQRASLPPPPEPEVSRERAFEKFREGYTRSRTRAGDDLETIESKLQVLFNRWWDDLRANAAEHDEPAR